MSTDLYGIRVLEHDAAAKRVRLRVFILHYAIQPQGLPADEGFLLQVLRLRARDRANPALDAKISDEQIFDERFIKKAKRRFIKDYKIVATRNYPEDLSKYDNVYFLENGCWRDEAKLAQGDYDVWVSDPAYLAHLAIGDTWGTVAFSDTTLVALADAPPPAEDAPKPAGQLSLAQIQAALAGRTRPEKPAGRKLATPAKKPVAKKPVAKKSASNASAAKKSRAK